DRVASAGAEASGTEEELSKERLLAAEEASLRGFFGRVVRFYERMLRFALERPLWIVLGSALLVVLAFLSYKALGNELMPELDEGGFILDYWMPAGSSLEETNRALLKVDQILHSIPEVETTSRRTGLELGLSAVTEAHRGDFTVKLKVDHKRPTDEVMAEVRQKLKEQLPEDAPKTETVQLLSDMINDLETNEAATIQIKLFCEDAALLQEWAGKVGDAISKVNGAVEVLNGVENTISGPAVVFTVDASVAARAGFTPEEVATDAAALLEGEPAPTPVVSNDRAYII